VAPLSRLASRSARELDVVNATLTVPFPRISGVMSTATHVPDRTGPEDAVGAPAGAGALVYTRELSCHEVLATLRTSKPADESSCE
jgi:hypothetical protein